MLYCFVWKKYESCVRYSFTLYSQLIKCKKLSSFSKEECVCMFLDIVILIDYCYATKLFVCIPILDRLLNQIIKIGSNLIHPSIHRSSSLIANPDNLKNLSRLQTSECECECECEILPLTPNVPAWVVWISILNPISYSFLHPIINKSNRVVLSVSCPWKTPWYAQETPKCPLEMFRSNSLKSYSHYMFVIYNP